MKAYMATLVFLASCSPTFGQDVVTYTAVTLEVLKALEGSEGKILTANVRNKLAVDIENIVSKSGKPRIIAGVKVDSADKASYVEFIRPIMQRFPLLVVRVSPEPPRDYSVFINLEEVGLSPKSEYVVQSGETAVVVRRPGKPACEWAGTLQMGERKTISCRM